MVSRKIDLEAKNLINVLQTAKQPIVEFCGAFQSKNSSQESLANAKIMRSDKPMLDWIKQGINVANAEKHSNQENTNNQSEAISTLGM